MEIEIQGHTSGMLLNPKTPLFKSSLLFLFPKCCSLRNTNNIDKFQNQQNTRNSQYLKWWQCQSCSEWLRKHCRKWAIFWQIWPKKTKIDKRTILTCIFLTRHAGTEHVSNQPWQKQYCRLWPWFITQLKISIWDTLSQNDLTKDLNVLWMEIGSAPSPDKRGFVKRVLADTNSLLPKHAFALGEIHVRQWMWTIHKSAFWGFGTDTWIRVTILQIKNQWKLVNRLHTPRRTTGRRTPPAHWQGCTIHTPTLIWRMPF